MSSLPTANRSVDSGESDRSVSIHSSSNLIFTKKPHFHCPRQLDMHRPSFPNIHVSHCDPSESIDNSQDPDSAFYQAPSFTPIPYTLPPSSLSSSLSSLRPLEISSPSPSDHMSFADIDPQAVIALLHHPQISHLVSTQPAFSPVTTRSQRVLDERLVRSLRNASISDKQLLVRVASAADNLKIWGEELHEWTWGGSFSLEPVQGSASPELFPSGIPPQLRVSYEQRVAEISDGMDELDLDSMKEHILSIYTNPASQKSVTLSVPSPSKHHNHGLSEVTFLDELSLLMTHFMMVSLPLQIDLRQLLSRWKGRLEVLEIAPSYLQTLQFGQRSMEEASDNLTQFIDLVDNIFRENGYYIPSHQSQVYDKSLEVFYSSLKTTIGELGSSLDSMLDRVDWMGQSLPEPWIDDFEALESQYTFWANSFEILKLRVGLWSSPRLKKASLSPPLMASPALASLPKSSQSTSLTCSLSTASTSSSEQQDTVSSPASSSQQHTTVVIQIINQPPSLVDVSPTTRARMLSDPQPISQGSHRVETQVEIATSGVTTTAGFDQTKEPHNNTTNPSLRLTVVDQTPYQPQLQRLSIKSAPNIISVLPANVDAATQTDLPDLSNITPVSIRFPSMTSRSSMSESEEPRSPIFPLTPTIHPVDNSRDSMTNEESFQIHQSDLDWDEDRNDSMAPLVGDGMLTPSKQVDTNRSRDSSPSVSPSPTVPVPIGLHRVRNRKPGVADNITEKRPTTFLRAKPRSSAASGGGIPNDADLNKRILNILGQIGGDYTIQLSPGANKVVGPATSVSTTPSGSLRSTRISKRPSIIPLRHKGSRVQSLSASYNGGRSVSDIFPTTPRTLQTGQPSLATPTPSFTLVPESQARKMPSHSSLRDGYSSYSQKRNFSSSSGRANMNSTSSRGGSEIRAYRLFFPENPNNKGTPGERNSKPLFIRETEEGRLLVRIGGGWADLADWLRTFIEHHYPRIRSKEAGEVSLLEPLDCEDVPLAQGDGDDTFGFISLDSGLNTNTTQVSPRPRVGSSHSSGRRSISNPLGSPTSATFGDCGAPRASLAGPGFDKTRGAVSLSNKNRQWVDDMVSKAMLASGSGNGSAGPHDSSSNPIAAPSTIGRPSSSLGEDGMVQLSDMGTVRTVRRLAKGFRPTI